MPSSRSFWTRGQVLRTGTKKPSLQLTITRSVLRHQRAGAPTCLSHQSHHYPTATAFATPTNFNTQLAANNSASTDIFLAAADSIQHRSGLSHASYGSTRPSVLPHLAHSLSPVFRLVLGLPPWFRAEFFGLHLHSIICQTLISKYLRWRAL